MIKPTQEELFRTILKNKNFEKVLDEVVETTRCGTINRCVFKRINDNTFWQVYYERSSDGEYNEFRDETVEIQQVEPFPVTIIKYREV